MAIEGLITTPQTSEINVSDEVGAAVDALTLLHLVNDRDQVVESVTSEFAALSNSGEIGEPFVQLPHGLKTLEELYRSSDAATYSQRRRYPETSVYSELWTPGTDPDGYKAEELDLLTLGGNGNFPSHARLAVHNPDSEREPLLHFLSQPFDDMYPEDGKKTQLESIDEATATFNAEHEDFEMTPLNAKAVAFIALMRRIKGEDMPMAWGWMRDATLPRKTVRGDSIVGRVGSYDDRLRLRRSRGRADSYIGVGLSVGSKVLEPQAS